MRRGKPLQANPEKTREWLDRSRGGSTMRRTQLQPRSEPTRKLPPDYAEFARNRDERIGRAGGKCEVSTMLADLWAALDGDDPMRPKVLYAVRRCTGKAVTAHHTLARGMGGHGDNSVERLRATCPPCHDFTEAHPTLAEKAGLKVRHST